MTKARPHYIPMALPRASSCTYCKHEYILPCNGQDILCGNKLYLDNIALIRAKKAAKTKTRGKK